MDLLFLLLALCLGFIVGWFLATKLSELKIKFLEEKVADLGREFKGISLEVLKQSGETFLQLAETKLQKFHTMAQSELDKKEGGIKELLKPVKESLEKFDAKVLELEKSRVSAYSSLKEQVQHLISSQKELKNETSNLAKALRAPNIRGKWGEIQLRRVVELAGMVSHCDFFEQETAANDEGRLFRPDLLIKLPGGRNIVVDAKVPLNGYLEAIECENEEIKRQKMKEHARQIRAHMTTLGRKAYWDQFQPTPEFVVLFLPAETFFSGALEFDPALIEAGVEEGVIIATPTTLIALLKSVSYGWKQESLSKNAEQMSQLGKELYKRIGDLSLHWTKMGRSLESAVEAYNKASGSLEARVLVTARKIKELETGELDQEIEPLEGIEKIPRTLMSLDP